MTTETILTSQQIANIWPKAVEEISFSKFNDVLKFARDIEQAVLQSPEIQALRGIAKEYDALHRHMSSGGDFHEFQRDRAAMEKKT